MKAKITAYLDGLGIEKTLDVSGSEDFIYICAHNFTNSLASDYIDENDIWDEHEQDLIYSLAGHEIEWEQEMMYVVYEDDVAAPPIAVFYTRSDAEEFILNECENYVYEVMMADDPEDVFGEPEWNYRVDYKLLLNDAGRTFHIAEIPVFA